MKSPVVITETYHSFERLIYDTVGRFVRRFGGDFEEYVAEANRVFMVAYNAHDAARGKFSTLLVNSIWNRLTNVSIAEARRRSRYNTTLDADEDGRTAAVAVDDQARFGLENWDISEFSDDAREIVDVVLNTPIDLKEIIDEKGGRPPAWRNSLQEYFSGMGWTHRRIADAFREVGAALV